MTKRIAVLGATGRVGHVVTDRLLDAGVQVRALGRSPERLAPFVARGAEPRVGQATDPKFLADAFRQVDAAFVLLPTDPGHPDPAGLGRSVADAVGAALQVARVQRVVTVSSIGADQAERNGPIAGLHYLERRINAIPGIHTVHLRPGFFFENWLPSIDLIRNAGINGGGLAPDLPMIMIASRDVGSAAAGILANPVFTGQRPRELQGPRLYTSREVTTIIGQAIGRPDLAYIQFPEPDVRAAFLSAGYSAPLSDSYLEMFRGFNEGWIKPLEQRSAASSTPTTFEQFAREVMAPAFGH